jgi:CubicO group peptidase (beta-lactamase class C family)
MSALPDFAPLDALAASTGFSGTVLVTQGSEVLYSGAWGYAQRAEAIPNRIDTRFGIASGTKGFTAVAVAQLAAAGELAYDDPVSRWFAGPWIDPAATVGQLLSHSSGCWDYLDEDAAADAAGDAAGGERLIAAGVDLPWYRLAGPLDYLPLFAGRRALFPAGERFKYSNSGFVLLAGIVERVAGRSYREYVAERILAPLGMERSGFFALDALPAGSAYGYLDAAGAATNLFKLPIYGGGDGGLFATAGDMDRFWRGLLAGRAGLAPAAAKDLLRPLIATGGEAGDRYGRGFWCWLGLDGAETPYLVGSDPGVSFVSKYLPATDRVVAVLANTQDGAWPIDEALAGLLE